jgi:UDP-N-acetylmuramoyl-tripeptide--D-alanyl-D-alanine ligase
MDLVENVLRAQACDDFCIQELGAWGPGTLDAGLELVKPDIGVVLNVRRDHYAAFRGLEQTQAEKAKVIECLPATGTAILNADDSYVWGMRSRTNGRVLGFGSNVNADFQVKNVCSVWPHRLTFDLLFGGACRRVRTQLIGEHLVGSAVAAIAIAHTLGVTLEEAVERIALIPPTARRMSPAFTDSGVAVVRDDFKATSDSLEEFLRFLQCARAERKVAVIGRISDYPGRSRAVYTAFAQSAAKIADLLIFVGERPENLWGGSRGSDEFLAEFRGQKATIQLFGTVRDASHFLQHELRAGDLLVLKGSGASDHLERIFLDHQTTVQCWRAQCGLITACDSCDLLRLPAEPGDALPETN